MNATKPIIVAGAGSIGCFVGGMLADAGRRVSLLARPRVIAEVEKNNGIRLTSFEGFDRHVESAKFSLSGDPLVFKTAGVVLVTVKSADTARIAIVIGDMPPLFALGSLGPRGPFCMPLRTSSKPMELSCRMPALRKHSVAA